MNYDIITFIMASENPNWQQEVHSIIPHWGTKDPVTLQDVLVPIFDVSGRPLFESSMYNPANVPFQPASGPKDGGRDSYLVNSSAYAEVSRAFHDSLGVISFIRDAILPYGSKVTTGSIQGVLNTVDRLPVWMVLRSDNPTQNGLLPTYITGASKIARGGLIPYYSDIQRRFIYSDGSQPESLPVTSQDFLATVYDDNLLIDEDSMGLNGHTPEACPSSRPQITQFAEVLFDNPTPNKDAIGERLGLTRKDLQRVRQFGNAYSQATFITGFLKMADINYKSSFVQHGATVWVGGKKREIDLAAEYLKSVNSSLRRMNEALDRKPPPQVTYGDILPRTSGAAFGLP